MKILAIYSGEYGARHIENIRRNSPRHWEITTWQAPLVLPPVIDYPEDYLPGEFMPADLLLSFAEHKGVAELIPEIAKLCGAQAVIAGIDNEAWLPRGLARQLRGWLENMGILCVTPKPLCSLTEQDYGMTRRQRIPYTNPLIAEFAHHFGQPHIRLTIDERTLTIASAEVERDAFCGCARFVAEKLVGMSVTNAEQEAGLAHHHYPCLASMGIDPDFGDTLMHISGNIMKDDIADPLKPYQVFLRPGQRHEE